MNRVSFWAVVTTAILLSCTASARAEETDFRLVGVWSSVPPDTYATQALVFEVAANGQYRILSGGAAVAPQVVHGQIVAAKGRWGSTDELGRMDGGTYEFLSDDVVELDGTAGSTLWYRTPIGAPELPAVSPAEPTVVVVEEPQVVENVVVVEEPPEAFTWYDRGLCSYCCRRFDDAASCFHNAACLGDYRAECQYAWHCRHGVGIAQDCRSAEVWSARAATHQAAAAGAPVRAEGVRPPAQGSASRGWAQEGSSVERLKEGGPAVRRSAAARPIQQASGQPQPERKVPPVHQTPPVQQAPPMHEAPAAHHEQPPHQVPNEHPSGGQGSHGAGGGASNEEHHHSHQK